MANQEIQRHIIVMLVERIANELRRVLIDEVPDDDPIRLHEVKIGRFQQEPSSQYFRVSVQGGDLEKPDMMDDIVDPATDDNRLGFRVPPREIGGGELWWRKGTVRIELFFIYQGGVDEELARNRAYTVLGRIQNLIPEIYVSDLVDDFGERAIKLFRPRSTFYQTGGPPNSYVWRGKMIWECLTEWSPHA